MKTSILHLGLLVGALFSVNTASAQSVVTTTGGTANYVPKFSGSSTIVKSQIVDTGTNVGIGTASPEPSRLTVAKSLNGQTGASIGMDEVVSSEVIREEGYVFHLSNGTEVRILGAFTQAGLPSHCLVHIPSLRAQVEDRLSSGDSESVMKLQLQVWQDPSTGAPWCKDYGKGCSIIVSPTIPTP